MPIKKISSAGGGTFTTVLENPDVDGYMGYGSMSPDGTKIAYVYYPGTGNDQIRICNIDGTDDHMIAQATYYGAWTNVYWGAQYLAVVVTGSNPLVFQFFAENGDLPPSNIIPYLEWPYWTTGANNSAFVAKLTEQDVANEVQTNDVSYEQCAWSPSGRYLYFEAYHRHDSSNLGYEVIVRVDIEDLYGHNTEIIAHGQTNTPGPQIDITWPALDPTGTQLCVTKKDYSGYYYSLWLMESDGSGETLLFNNAAWATWNADGTKLIAYATGGDYAWATPLVIDASTGEATVVTTDTSSYGYVGFVGDRTGYVESPNPIPHPSTSGMTGKVWFQSDSDALIHKMNVDDTGNTLADPRSAPDHVWIGYGGSDTNGWGISPLGDYVYFIDTDHSDVKTVWRSWNNCTHYRCVYQSPAFITVAAGGYNVSWDGSKVLISISNNQAYALIGPNGERFGPAIDTSVATDNGYPYTVIYPWTLLHAQSAMQCMSPDASTAMVWNQSTNHIGFLTLATGSITDLGVLGWIAPSWSSNDQISYLDGSGNVKIVAPGAPTVVLKSFATGGSLNYVNMWNPAGTELIVDNNSGVIKRYSVSGTPTFLNNLSIYPSWPIGWT